MRKMEEWFIFESKINTWTLLWIYSLGFPEIVPDNRDYWVGKNDFFIFSRKVYIMLKTG